MSRTNKTLSEEETQYVLLLISQGLTVNEIAKHLRVNVAEIRSIARGTHEHNRTLITTATKPRVTLESSEIGNDTYSKESVKKVRKLLLSGLTDSEVADETGISLKQISKIAAGKHTHAYGTSYRILTRNSDKRFQYGDVYFTPSKRACKILRDDCIDAIINYKAVPIVMPRRIITPDEWGKSVRTLKSCTRNGIWCKFYHPIRVIEWLIEYCKHKNIALEIDMNMLEELYKQAKIVNAMFEQWDEYDIPEKYLPDVLDKRLDFIGCYTK